MTDPVQTLAGGLMFGPWIGTALTVVGATIGACLLFLADSLPEAIGVACVPLSAFCREGSPTASALANWVRFTFVKREDTLRTAIERLAGLRLG